MSYAVFLFFSPLTPHYRYLVPSGAPQNLTAMGKSPTSVQLQWDLPARPHRQGEIVLYEIMFRKRLEVTEDDTVNTTDKHVLIEGLDINTDYIFQIRAYTSRGAGPWSNQLPFRTFGQCELNYL
jgi:netrin-G3 ligand